MAYQSRACSWSKDKGKSKYYELAPKKKNIFYVFINLDGKSPEI